MSAELWLVNTFCPDPSYFISVVVLNSCTNLQWKSRMIRIQIFDRPIHNPRPRCRVIYFYTKFLGNILFCLWIAGEFCFRNVQFCLGSTQRAFLCLGQNLGYPHSIPPSLFLPRSLPLSNDILPQSTDSGHRQRKRQKNGIKIVNDRFMFFGSICVMMVSVVQLSPFLIHRQCPCNAHLFLSFFVDAFSVLFCVVCECTSNASCLSFLHSFCLSLSLFIFHSYRQCPFDSYSLSRPHSAQPTQKQTADKRKYHFFPSKTLWIPRTTIETATTSTTQKKNHKWSNNNNNNCISFGFALLYSRESSRKAKWIKNEYVFVWSDDVQNACTCTDALIRCVEATSIPEQTTKHSSYIPFHLSPLQTAHAKATTLRMGYQYQWNCGIKSSVRAYITTFGCVSFDSGFISCWIDHETTVNSVCLYEKGFAVYTSLHIRTICIYKYSTVDTRFV